MDSYESLAGAYDVLTEDVQYLRRAEWLDRQLKRAKRPVETVLDLGCGTGTMACLLARKGYRVTASDASEEMLTEAMRKAEALSENRPFFLCQPMQRLRLLEPVDAVISTLDALNYVTREKDVRETMRRACRWLQPGGVFLFDINSPYKLRRMAGQMWTDEQPDVCCFWQTDFSERTQICTYRVQLFTQRPDGAWDRSYEEHREKAWDPEDLKQWLEEAGFDKIRISGDLRQSAPRPDEDRLIFRCEKRQETGKRGN
jgi:ubiquinone/menaquinone biosynthesis C-methylase UbiE